MIMSQLIPTAAVNFIVESKLPIGSNEPVADDNVNIVKNTTARNPNNLSRSVALVLGGSNVDPDTRRGLVIFTVTADPTPGE